MKHFVAIFGMLVLSACGAVYHSPKVPANSETVRVVPLNAVTVTQFNRHSYRPRELPAVFFQNAGGAYSAGAGGAAPAPTVDRPDRPSGLTTRIPPDPQTGPYLVGVGDVLTLATKSSGSTVEELSGLLAAQNRRQGYTVQDDGAIAIPDVGRIVVAGRTLEEVEARVFDALVSNNIDPSFSIEISEFNSKRVSIGGAVRQPTILPIRLSPLRLGEAVTAAGGITAEDQDYVSIRIYRDGKIYQIPLNEYLSKPNLQSLLLAENDSVFVDTEYDLARAQTYFAEQIQLAQFRQNARSQALRALETEVSLRRAALNEQRTNFQTRLEVDGVDRDYVYLTGEVKNPSRFVLPFGRHATLADALYDSGGFSNETANPGQIYVLRSLPSQLNPDHVTALHLDARNATNMIFATKLQLRPNDVVFISEQPVTRWSRVVRQITPSLINAGVAATN